MLGRILLVDDDLPTREMLTEALTRRSFDVTALGTAKEAQDILLREDFHVVIVDQKLGNASGLDICREVAASRDDTSVVLITAFGSVESAIAAMRGGAYDYVTKPFDLNAFALVVERAYQHSKLRQEVKHLRQELRDAKGFSEMIGDSPPMIKLYELIARIAETEATIFITGESGTGKELAARAIHQRSRRGKEPFVAINCAALPEPLLESELFGHTKGAFTDAKSARAGLFVKANGGTLFMDEIGEMPLGMQAKLLRVLQERTIRPIGSDAEIPIDTRIITATNRDLEAEVAAKQFREDLFYRINVVQIQIPPLRVRGSDVLMLAQSFLLNFAKQNNRPAPTLSPAAAERLLSYPWPGNVRELSNCMERAVALAPSDEIRIEELSDKIQNFQPTRISLDGTDPDALLTLEEVEKRYILHTLTILGGNKAHAAQVLGVDRRTLYRKLDRYQGTSTPEEASLE
jgi:two-component system response regulator AtoC